MNMNLNFLRIIHIEFLLANLGNVNEEEDKSVHNVKNIQKRYINANRMSACCFILKIDEGGDGIHSSKTCFTTY